MDLRVGTGIDFHRLIEDHARPLLLAAVELPGSLALDGHSDADIVLHATADAILGALGLGDIGEYFPDTDADLHNMDSREIIRHALQAVRERGFRISNIDVTLIGERPKLAPQRAAVRSSLAQLLEISEEQTGLKATTTEKMGALGRKEGLACMATVLLIKED